MHFSSLDSYIGKKLLPIHFSQLQKFSPKFSGGNFHLFTTIADIALLACILNAVVVMFDREVFCTLLPELSSRVFNWWRKCFYAIKESWIFHCCYAKYRPRYKCTYITVLLAKFQISSWARKKCVWNRRPRNRAKGQRQGTKPRSSNKAKSQKVLRRNLSAKFLIYANFSMFDIL